jgi:hypothetical protein
MFFFLCIVLLGIVTACLPIIMKFIARYLPDVKFYSGSTWLPILAGILIVVSTQLPNIHISNQTSTFQQHFVGGGMYSACLYLYVKQVFNWKLYWLVDLLALFAWVSAFGVANKMIEFALLELKLANIYTGDAYWDLLANTLGGFVGYLLIFKFVKLSRSKVLTS